MTTSTKPRPRVKPERRASFEPFIDGVAFVGMTITTPRKTKEPKIDAFGYFLRKIDADFGLGFRLKKAGSAPDGGDTEYDVNIDLQRGYHSCTCKGNTYSGHCKHVEALLALIQSGKIDAPAQPLPPPPNAIGTTPENHGLRESASARSPIIGGLDHERETARSVGSVRRNVCGRGGALPHRPAARPLSA